MILICAETRRTDPMIKRLCAVIATIILCLMVVPACAVVYVSIDSPGPQFDGKSWATAYHKIQDGINAATAGDEVWVAAGSYQERITLKAGVNVYGGFPAAGGVWSSRNPRTNISLIDANNQGQAVMSQSTAITPSTHIDGFTIANSNGGCPCGIECSQGSSPTISNNVIMNNNTGIIIDQNASPVILNNTIKQNTSIGIDCHTDLNAIIANNVISGSNTGIQINALTSMSVVNNTIVNNAIGVSWNSLVGIHLSNNIISANTSYGIQGGGTATIIKYNCVFDNKNNYSGISDPTGTNGNISVDPMLANESDDIHIQPDSPCRNNGLNSEVDAAWCDIDGQSRILDGQVDIGADESDGTHYNYTAKPLFTPGSGTYYTPQTVTVTCATEGAVIHYTIDNTDPTETSPVIASGGTVQIDTTTTLKARAWKSGLNPGPQRTGLFKITGTVAAPVISVPSGNYDSALYVTLTCETPGSAIYYSLDGTDPTISGRYYNGTPIRIDRSSVLIAVGKVLDWQTSPQSKATYTLRAPGVIRVKADASGPMHDGQSWDTAYLTLPEAVRTSIYGDEIWVAKGIYTGTTSLARKLSIYGGFAGFETSRSERNTTTNETVLDGENARNLITSDALVDETATIDGFVFRRGNAYYGGAIYSTGGMLNIVNNRFEDCSSNYGGAIDVSKTTATISGNTILRCTGASLAGGIRVYSGNSTIRGNLISGCVSGSGGGGIYLGGDAVVTGNRIIGNNAQSGGGVYCEAYYCTVADNILAGNTADNGGGLYTYGDHASVYGNTIVGNSAINGGGVFVDFALLIKLTNNIVAFNSSGILYKNYSQFNGTLRNNCVFGNTVNYKGMTDPTGTNGNISADPQFAGFAFGDLHIQPGSPCINAGNDSDVQDGSTDIDGQNRIVGAHIDIGADESDGRSWQGTPPVIRVKPDGDDSKDGSSWNLAKRSVQSAINSVITGGEVWVKAGTYHERLVVAPFIRLLGGFNGSEGSSSQRDWTANETLLNADQGGSVITVPGGYLVAVVDGLTLTGGKNSTGGGVKCVGSAVITHNKITGNTAGQGGGIYSQSDSQILENTISANIATNTGFAGSGYGGGLYTEFALAKGNIIADNTASAGGGGIYVWGPYRNNGTHATGYVLSNTILRNSASNGGGIGTYGNDVSVQNNLIVSNVASSSASAMSISSGAYAKLWNNTIVDNHSPNTSAAVETFTYGAMANSIVAFNSAGIASGGNYTYYNNCVFGNSGGNYIGISSNQIIDSLSEDPLFVNAAAGDYRLQTSSKCIDAGTSSWMAADDMDGNPRSKDGNGDGVSKPDIGCYEAPTNYSSIIGAKSLQNGSLVGITDAVITAAQSDRFYVETSDRIHGIGILGSAQSVGKRVTIEGTMTSVDGERLIVPTWIGDNGSAPIPAPWFLNSNSLGGGPIGLQTGVSNWRLVQDGAKEIVSCTGVNNIGLLIKTAGRVGYADDSCFYIDDGSSFDDGRQNTTGIKVLRLPSVSYVPQTGDYVVVTGISSCFNMEAASHYARLIRPVSVDVISE